VERQGPDERDIERHTRALLKRAETKGQFPTPVDDIIEAAGLTQPKESFLSPSVIAEAPAHLQIKIRRLSGKVRAMLDRKEREIHVDPSIHNRGRVNFHKLHEVSHDIYPWQSDLGYADDDATFAASIKAKFEVQANIGASNLLFQHEHFQDLARQYAIGHAAILELSKLVGASGHATFRRFVKVSDAVVAGVVLDLSPSSRDPLGYRRDEVVISEKWGEQFGEGSWPGTLLARPYTFVEMAEDARTSGVPVSSGCVLPNLRNEPTSLNVELYSNQYRLFALIWKPRRETLRRRRIIMPGVASA
jgi:hypothetical protein